MHDDRSNKNITRRDAIRLLGTTLAATPLASVLACDATRSAQAESIGEQLTAAGAGSAAPRARRWATGGTAAMRGVKHYPDPFRGEVDRSCTPTCAMMLGPCHDKLAPEREDISEGQPGLPVRLGLRFLDESCEPLRDADVDIWHCDARGIYSSETNDTPSFCTGDDEAALAARWFRGHRKTDRHGVAWFNTCFPGWYHGRAIHIHYTVRKPARDGVEYLTSQIGFPAQLIEDLCTNHPDYIAHGLPDTPNAKDSIIPDDDEYIADTARMRDGALLAYKTFIVRSSLDTDLCTEGMTPGGFPDGGLPPGFPDGGFPPGPPPGTASKPDAG